MYNGQKNRTYHITYLTEKDKDETSKNIFNHASYSFNLKCFLTVTISYKFKRRKSILKNGKISFT